MAQQKRVRPHRRLSASLKGMTFFQLYTNFFLEKNWSKKLHITTLMRSQAGASSHKKDLTAHCEHLVKLDLEHFSNLYHQYLLAQTLKEKDILFALLLVHPQATPTEKKQLKTLHYDNYAAVYKQKGEIKFGEVVRKIKLGNKNPHLLTLAKRTIKTLQQFEELADVINPRLKIIKNPRKVVSATENAVA